MALLARGGTYVVRASNAGWVTGHFLVDHLVADPLLNVLPAAAVVVRGDAATCLGCPSAFSSCSPRSPSPSPASGHGRPPARPLVHPDAARLGRFRRAGPSRLAHRRHGPRHRSRALRHPPRPRSRLVRRPLRRPGVPLPLRLRRPVRRPPGAYVLRQRLERAAHLLGSTPESIGRIAARVGYTSEAAFSRAFTRASGESPRTWRKTTD
jgi:AraC-like DNA-binding protein